MGARWGAGAECDISGNSSIAWTGLWSDMMVSGVALKCAIRVVVSETDLDVRSIFDCGEKRCGESVCEANNIRSVYPGMRLLVTVRSLQLSE